jgi:hypothetical protein
MMTMKKTILTALAVALMGTAVPVVAFQQFPFDVPTVPPGGLVIDWDNDGGATGTAPNFADPLVPPVPIAVQKHFGAGDGYAKMADGSGIYTFGFSDGTGLAPGMFMDGTLFKAEFPGPTIDYYEGQQFYLTLTNVGMKKRPDLFDPHTVHFHGFPNAATVFDGEPMASFGIRMMSDLTYYYNLVEPGTYMYHCHVEATEHMEMGMLANLVVRPRQDLYTQAYGPVIYNTRPYTKFGYNDCINVPGFAPTYDPVETGKVIANQFDNTIPGFPVALAGPLCGSSGYTVDKLIQFSEFDPAFHQADLDAQPLPFADFESKYYMFNGRGYPDTIDPAAIVNNASEVNEANYPSQKIPSRIDATSTDTILVRLSNLSIQNFASIEFNGPPFKVVGKCARLLRGPGPDGEFGTADDTNLSYWANSVFIGPGETFDIIIYPGSLVPGTYYMYSRNLNQLSNDQMDRGGAMTEIVIN